MLEGHQPTRPLVVTYEGTVSVKRLIGPMNKRVSICFILGGLNLKYTINIAILLSVNEFSQLIFLFEII